MTVNEFLYLPGGLIGGFVWMGILRAMFGDSPNPDVTAFKAMALLMVLASVLAEAFPNHAVGGIRAALLTIGYLIVMIWFWKSRHLLLVSGARADG